MSSRQPGRLEYSEHAHTRQIVRERGRSAHTSALLGKAPPVWIEYSEPAYHPSRMPDHYMYMYMYHTLWR